MYIFKINERVINWCKNNHQGQWSVEYAIGSMGYLYLRLVESSVVDEVEFLAIYPHNPKYIRDYFGKLEIRLKEFQKNGRNSIQSHIDDDIFI